MTRIWISISFILLLIFNNTLKGNAEKNYNSILLESLSDSIRIVSKDTINIYPKDDNNDTLIPTRNRIWWFAELNNIPTKKSIEINIFGDGWRGGKYVFPVYSYNDEVWYRFHDSEIVDKKGKDGLWNFTLKKQFQMPKVYIARTYPYLPKRVEHLIKKYKKNPFFKYEIIGYSQLGYPIYHFSISNFSVVDSKKKKIWIQSRTHPGETQSSYVLEGIIDFLLGKANLKTKEIDLRKVCFDIIPIVNIDGIATGNSRYTPQGKDLERQWFKRADSTMILADSSALEVKHINNLLRKLSTQSKILLAINLHGKNALSGQSPFLYTNFKKKLEQHGTEGDTLYYNQLLFTKCLSSVMKDSIKVQMGYTPNQAMQEKPFPESWWWFNFKSSVTAFTLEITESLESLAKKRCEVEDFFKFGEYLAKGIYKYYIIKDEEENDKLKKPYYYYEDLEKFYEKNSWE